MAWTAALNLITRSAAFTNPLGAAGNVARSFGSTVTSSMSKAMMASNLAQKAFSSLTQAFFGAAAQAKQFSNIASRLNLRPAEVAQLSEAAEEAGIPLMALSKGLRDVQRFGAQGLTGQMKGELKEAGELLGLTESQFKTLAAGGKDAMLLISEKMRGMDDEAKKFLITQKLHGRNAQFMGQIYDKSGDEIAGMFKNQIASSDETIAANKKIYESVDTIKDAWNTFLAWVVARTEVLVRILAIVAKALADVGTVIGRVWELAKDWFEVMYGLGELLFEIVTLDFEGIVRVFNKIADKIKGIFSSLINTIVDFFKSRWNALIETLTGLLPSWLGKILKDKLTVKVEKEGDKEDEEDITAKEDDSEEENRRKTAKRRDKWIKENFLRKPPEMTKEEKAAADEAKKAEKEANEKRRWEAADNEEKWAILAERKAAARKEQEAAKEKFIEEQELKMKEKDQFWHIPPEAYKETADYIKARAKLAELQQEQLDLEKKIREEEEKKREEAAKAAEEEAKRQKEDLDRRREAARQERAWKDELFDAQVEYLRRNLDESEASALEKAQAELAIEQEKMTRLHREYAIASQEGDKERMEEIKKDILGQTLAIDQATRGVRKAEKDAAEEEKEKLRQGVAGTGSSLTAIGGGGNLALAPIDIAKSQLAVQKSMNENLTAIRNATTGRTQQNGYDSNSALLK